MVGGCKVCRIWDSYSRGYEGFSYLLGYCCKGLSHLCSFIFGESHVLGKVYRAAVFNLEYT
jgi:hypothetical protein